MSERTEAQIQSERLEKKARPDAYTVKELIDLCMIGKIRIPNFQRPLRWRGQEVVALFDSIYNGYPIGSLLLNKRFDVEEADVTFGLLRFRADKQQEAFQVIDGQQRITALVATIRNPNPTLRGGIFSVFFDLENRRFCRLINGSIPATWVPLSVLLDIAKLVTWQTEWPLKAERKELIQVAVDAMQAILFYRVPVTLLETINEHVLRIAFKRVNTTGVRMKEHEVFSGIFSVESQTRNALTQVALQVHNATGFGLVSQEIITRCIKCVLGLKPGGTVRDESKIPTNALEPTQKALTSVVAFLMNDAELPHMSVVPYGTTALMLLSRYFALIPNPSPRARLILSWWVWWGALSEHHQSSSKQNIEPIQRLLSESAAKLPHADETLAEAMLRDVKRYSLKFPDASITWNRQSAKVRACLAALLSRSQFDDEDASIDNLMRTEDETPEAEPSQDDMTADETPWQFSSIDGQRLGKKNQLADVIVHTRGVKPEAISRTPTWLSHQLLTTEILSAFERGDVVSGRRLRSPHVNAWLKQYFSVRCGIGQSERPSIRALVDQVGEIA